MYSGLLIILLPLFFGYLIPIKQPSLLHNIHRLLSLMVYVILFFMGISLAFLDNLSANLVTIFLYAGVFFICIISANLAALALLDRQWPWKNAHQQEKLPSRLGMALESLQLCGVVAIGFVLGLTHISWLIYATQASEFALIFLLLLVGIQLRNSGMSLREITLNRRGMIIALVVVFSAMVGGAIAAWLLGLPIRTGLAMSSAYGWYSLSGIILTDSLGPVLGSAAFFNDLARELVAIMLIPALVRRNVSSAVGICGATSMDFTLSVLQRSGGLAIVPAAIVHGFILSLFAPVLLAFFSAP